MNTFQYDSSVHSDRARVVSAPLLAYWSIVCCLVIVLLALGVCSAYSQDYGTLPPGTYLPQTSGSPYDMLPPSSSRRGAPVQYYPSASYNPPPVPTSAPQSQPPPPTVPSAPEPAKDDFSRYAYPAAKPPPAPVKAPTPPPAPAMPSSPLPANRSSWTSAENIEALRRENYLLNERLRQEQNHAGLPYAPAGRVAYVTHRVERGDSLWGLAIRYKSSVNAIRSFNYLPGDRLISGQNLHIPVADPTPYAVPYYVYSQVPPTPEPKPSEKAKPSPTTTSKSGKHIVKFGETLSVIAQHYEVSSRAIQSANALRSQHRIYAGQELIIPGRTDAEIAELKKKPLPTAPQTPACSYPAPQPKNYSAEARPYEPITPAKIAKAPAQKARTADEPTVPSSAALPSYRSITTYRVQKRDTLASISGAFGLNPSEIRSLNRLSGDNLPAAGEELLLPSPTIASL